MRSYEQTKKYHILCAPGIFSANPTVPHQTLPKFLLGDLASSAESWQLASSRSQRQRPPTASSGESPPPNTTQKMRENL